MQLLAFDLDGTTLRNHSAVPQENLLALRQAGARGVILVPATGRIFSFIPREILSLEHVGYLICANGAAIYDRATGKSIYENSIPNQKALEVYNCLQRHCVYTELYIEGIAYTEMQSKPQAIRQFHMQQVNTFFLDKDFTYTSSLSELLEGSPVRPEKINLPYIPKALRAKIMADLKKIDGIKLTSSIPDNIEINNATATKGTALKWLTAHLHLSQNQVMAIGDNGNDVEMLEFAGVSVAMQDGAKAALQAAKFLTAACGENGLAKAIQRHILDKTEQKFKE